MRRPYDFNGILIRKNELIEMLEKELEDKNASLDRLGLNTKEDSIYENKDFVIDLLQAKVDNLERELWENGYIISSLIEKIELQAEAIQCMESK